MDVVPQVSRISRAGGQVEGLLVATAIFPRSVERRSRDADAFRESRSLQESGRDDDEASRLPGVAKSLC